MSTPDAGTSLSYPTKAFTVDLTSVDFDCTLPAHFPSGFATEIHVGISAPADVAVIHFGDTVAVTYKNCIQGRALRGCFTKILKTGTTATGLVARGF